MNFEEISIHLYRFSRLVVTEKRPLPHWFNCAIQFELPLSLLVVGYDVPVIAPFALPFTCYLQSLIEQCFEDDLLQCHLRLR